MTAVLDWFSERLAARRERAERAYQATLQSFEGVEEETVSSKPLQARAALVNPQSLIWCETGTQVGEFEFTRDGARFAGKKVRDRDAISINGRTYLLVMFRSTLEGVPS